MQPKSCDIVAECDKYGYTAEWLADNGEDGDMRIVLWRVGPVLVIETNGNSVWEDDYDFRAFALAQEFGYAL